MSEDTKKPLTVVCRRTLKDSKKYFMSFIIAQVSIWEESE